MWASSFPSIRQPDSCKLGAFKVGFMFLTNPALTISGRTCRACCRACAAGGVLVVVSWQVEGVEEHHNGCAHHRGACCLPQRLLRGSTLIVNDDTFGACKSMSYCGNDCQRDDSAGVSVSTCCPAIGFDARTAVTLVALFALT